MQTLSNNQCHEVSGGISLSAELGAIAVTAGLFGAAEGAVLSSIGVTSLSTKAAMGLGGALGAVFTVAILSPASILEPTKFWGAVVNDLLGNA